MIEAAIIFGTIYLSYRLFRKPGEKFFIQDDDYKES